MVEIGDEGDRRARTTTRCGRAARRRSTGRSSWDSATTCGRTGSGRSCVGLSGGIDSALVATLAADALGPTAVRVLAMPSPYSSAESVEDALDCADRLGVRIDVVPITDVFEAYRRTLAELLTGAQEGLAAGEHPGSRARQPADGAVEHVRIARARDREQERVRGRVRDPVRRHGGRVRAHQGRAQDPRLRGRAHGGTSRSTRRARRSPNGR